MATVLFEIGTEELPAGYLPATLAQLGTLARAQCAAARIAFADLQVWGTPRRLVLYLTDVAEQQAPAVREVRGPAVQDAFASNGEPTQAAMGFARSHGMAVADLRIRKIDNGEFVTAIFRDEGQPTFELLPGLFTQLITGLTFPKSMRWDAGAVRFARPIRWLVALMDDSIVPLVVGEVSAGRLTRGHRYLAPAEVLVPTAAAYLPLMEENLVIVQPDERRELIRRQLERLAREDEAVLLDADELLTDTTYRVEYPTALRGRIDESLLTLPPAVLLHVLRSEQHFFPLAAPSGVLLPGFLVVRDGDQAFLHSVRVGYEGVARAKLLDALFFFEQDCQQPLPARGEALRGIIFQEQLGTMYDKAARLESLTGLIAAWLQLSPEERQQAERGGRLAKADLSTAMVIEHPSLRGVMGGIYARLSGETEEVATALSEQYLPQQADDPLPAGQLGRILALADNVDTISACYAIGLAPTATDDPFALHHAALRVVRLLAEGDLPLALSHLLEHALRLLTVELSKPREQVLGMLAGLLRQRLTDFFTARKVPRPLQLAVLERYADVPADAWRVAQVLARQVDEPAFAEIIRAATRLANITRHGAGEELQPALLREPAEVELLQNYQQSAARAEELARARRFDEFPALLAELTPAVERFFSDILIMAEDPALRQARLALARRVLGVYGYLGNLAGLG